MNKQEDTEMFQVSTLQALALGYSRSVTDIEHLMPMETSALEPSKM